MKSTERKPMRSAAKRRARPPVSFRRVPAFEAEESTSLSEFSQVIAHRIGGLLSTIEGFTDILVEGIDTPEDRETAFGILESVNRIESILHDLKHYEDEIDVRRAPITVKHLLNGILAVLADSDAERVRVQSTVPNDTIVKVDERLIRQALLSLLRNALERTRNEKSAISLSVFQDEDTPTISLHVENPGGMDTSADTDRVFDAFYTTKAHNLGLGLTMARRFARIHEGDIKLAQATDELVSFVMNLPATKGE